MAQQASWTRRAPASRGRCRPRQPRIPVMAASTSAAVSDDAIMSTYDDVAAGEIRRIHSGVGDSSLCDSPMARVRRREADDVLGHGRRETWTSSTSCGRERASPELRCAVAPFGLRREVDTALGFYRGTRLTRPGLDTNSSTLAFTAAMDRASVRAAQARRRKFLRLGPRMCLALACSRNELCYR